jgi:hypothetical protein
MKKAIISLVVLIFIFTLSSCVTSSEPDLHKWDDLKGKYYITFFGETGFAEYDLISSTSFIELKIADNGKCYGTFRMTAADGTFANIDSIDIWWYNDDENTISLVVNGGDPIAYNVVEYGSIIKFEGNGLVLIAER